MIDDITVIIRSTTERTESVCHQIIARQVAKSNIVVVRERPFVNAVRATFNIGVQAGKTWTMAVDADILLTSTAIMDMIHRASEKPKHTFIYQGCVLDKLFNDIRPGGPHLYRTALLSHAIKMVPLESTHIRPESHTYSKMADHGFHFYQDSEIYGLHDYEQYKGDLYRKAFVHAKKHAHLTQHFLSAWAKSDDPDHAVAIAGYLKGLAHQGNINIDAEFFKTIEQDKQLNLNEKDDLHGLPENFVTTKILEFQRRNPDLCRPERFIKSTYRKKVGVLKKLLWRIGGLVEHFGKALKSFSGI